MTAKSASSLDRETILAAVPAGVLAVAVTLGMDRGELIRAAGLSEAQLADPDARVPVRCDLRLWEALAPQQLGLEIGQRLGLGAVGIVGHVMRHGSTVADALALMQRFAAVVHPELMPRVERRETPAGSRMVFVRPPTPAFAQLREPVYAQAASTVSVMETLLGRPVRATWVTYPLSRPHDAARHERFFAAPVAWDGALFEVAFDAELLARPLPRADAALLPYLTRHAEAMQAELGASTDIVASVRREIGFALAEGEPRSADVARRLAMSARTMARRLGEAGTSFSAVVEAERIERATRLLADARLTSAQVAVLLGYAEPAPFHRAFKRWMGVAPAEWRRRHATRAIP
ncbi:MAG TPA: AraC family transcriptional regulator ligand-binding domain-containing protein [Gemmatimonadaceae bacterium]|nr:AraC family transcriptional regulator ligand-binding domain-containing protein [Gemmatimonadaceae bacterium]